MTKTILLVLAFTLLTAACSSGSPQKPASTEEKLFNAILNVLLYSVMTTCAVKLGLDFIDVKLGKTGTLITFLIVLGGFVAVLYTNIVKIPGIN